MSLISTLCPSHKRFEISQVKEEVVHGYILTKIDRKTPHF